MLLRVSGTASGVDVELSAVNGEASPGAGVEHGDGLVAFTEAVMKADDAEMQRQRPTLRRLLGDAAFVDCCGVIGSFNVVDRVADATGIPLDDRLVAGSAEIRDELDLARFASSVNTPAG